MRVLTGLACAALTVCMPVLNTPRGVPDCAMRARHARTQTHTQTQGVRAKVLGPGGRETEVMLEGDLKLGLALCDSKDELERHGPVIKQSLRYSCTARARACMRVRAGGRTRGSGQEAARMESEHPVATCASVHLMYTVCVTQRVRNGVAGEAYGVS